MRKGVYNFYARGQKSSQSILGGAFWVFFTMTVAKIHARLGKNYKIQR